MSGEPPKENQGESEYIRLRRNLLNIGIFAAEILLLAIAGPALVRFFLPVIIGWLIAQLANPLVHFLEKHLHIFPLNIYLILSYSCILEKLLKNNSSIKTNKLKIPGNIQRTGIL